MFLSSSGFCDYYVSSVLFGIMSSGVLLCAEYHLESPGHVPTAVGPTSVAITLSNFTWPRYCLAVGLSKYDDIL